VADWVEGLLCGAEEEAVESLVANDERAAAAARWFRALRDAGTAGKASPLPPEVRRMVEWRGPGDLPGAGSRFRRLAGTLAFDSLESSGSAGRRGAGSGQHRERGALRQQIYEAEGVDIVVTIAPLPRPDRLYLRGRVLPNVPSSPGATSALSVQLLSADSEAGLTTTDELGEFSFTSVPAGTYELVVGSLDFEVLVAPLELRG